MPLFTQRSEIKATKTLIRKTYGMSLSLAIHSGSKAAYLHHFPFQWVRNFMSPLEDDFSGEGQYQKVEIMDSIVAFRQKNAKTSVDFAIRHQIDLV